jgi:molybdopterin synthase sulfur carrier subunit
MNDAMINVLYFAWMREHTGTASEQITLPDGAKTVGDLMPLLMARSAGHALALKNMAAVRVAVNRSYGDLKTAVAAGDEIAFFPPVTGG